jgi:general secretion pathway protein G
MRLPNEPKILFPWESRGGVRRFFRLGRLRPFVVIFGVVGFVTLVGARERRASGVRQTQATLLGARRGIEAYMADHDGGCPQSLEAALPEPAKDNVPKDAWGRPLRFVCPGRWEGTRYELMSDGPDGEPGGLDRVE